MRSRPASYAWRALITVLYLFLLAPIIVVLVISFDSQPYLRFPPQGFSLQWYADLASNTAFLTGFRVSAIVGVAVAVLATVVGVPAAIALYRHRFRGSGAVTGLFIAPLMVPAITLGLALMLVLTPLGLTGTYPGLMLAHLGITVPYVVRTTMMSLMTADTSCEEAARILGAGPVTTFFRVTLPLVRPGVLAGAVIAFLISFDEAVISLFVVGSGTTTLPVEIFRYVQYRTDPQVAALSVVLIAISVALVVIVERAVGLRRALR
ncbi:MAG: ABC transporter permease subunit [Streptosporangiales bacterium]|nr:ABC transporter permease subunit [Streptosporangiales bacterium]